MNSHQEAYRRLAKYPDLRDWLADMSERDDQPEEFAIICWSDNMNTELRDAEFGKRVLEQGKELVKESPFPWESISEIANYTLNSEEEARGWFTKILSIVEKYSAKTDVQYPALEKLLSFGYRDSWFYFASYWHWGKAKYSFEIPKESMIELRYIVLEEIFEKNRNDVELLRMCMKEIDHALENTIKSDDEYMTLFLQHLHLRQLELKGWQEHRDFLLMVRHKIQEILGEDE